MHLPDSRVSSEIANILILLLHRTHADALPQKTGSASVPAHDGHAHQVRRARGVERDARGDDDGVAVDHRVDLLGAVDGVQQQLVAGALHPRQHREHAPGQGELVHGLLHRGGGDDDLPGVELGHALGGLAGLGHHDDGLCAQVVCGGAGRVADGVCGVLVVDVVLDAGVDVHVKGVLLGLGDDAAHDLDRERRILAHGRLPGEVGS